MNACLARFASIRTLEEDNNVTHCALFINSNKLRSETRENVHYYYIVWFFFYCFDQMVGFHFIFFFFFPLLEIFLGILFSFWYSSLDKKCVVFRVSSSRNSAVAFFPQVDNEIVIPAGSNGSCHWVFNFLVFPDGHGFSAHTHTHTQT